MSEPPGDDDVRRLAAAIGLDVPPECLAGVAANLAALADHAARLAAPEE